MTDAVIKKLKITENMQDHLLNLRRGWRFGIDRRSLRGLLGRGWVTIEGRWSQDGTIWWELPYLTEEGQRIADAVHAELYPDGVISLDEVRAEKERREMGI